jgi:hypothetical protein
VKLVDVFVVVVVVTGVAYTFNVDVVDIDDH